ncbi:MAG TPA: glycoside hydrolase family 2 TIM barrel-domain containing protein [Verrucomicrobiae bacterium]|nr:glycoside hydrolase family 2 TIM barrel-domain containing protein [Verrucomicrobiae bacterium]
MLDADWLFHRGEVSNSNEVIQANFDDHGWQQVNLPHDYVLDGTYVYSPERWTRGHGYLPYEVGWYRRRLSVPQSAAGKILRLDFDGAFRDSQVWLNSQFLGRHPSGYTPFSFDVSQVARPGAENTLVVRVDPSQWEGWWYEGGGIYRHVYLTEMSPLHIAQWGSYVTSKVPDGDKGADAEADLTIQTTIENNSPTATNCEVDLEIIGPDGGLVKTIKSPSSRLRQNIVQQTVLQQPKLWSLESPSLYQLRTTILQDGKPVDSTTTAFGIRTLHYDAEKGFFLNGRHVEIQGAANHQDLPGVGTAVPDSLQPWRVEQLKKMGCNAWRTAHNPPNEALLDACDRLGMLVMDENRHLGDSYAHHSPPGTTATNFSDLATMIQRDRNHPSVIMWSMCNEERLQGTVEGAAIFSKMMNVVHRYDQTRPITSAMNGGWLTNGDADVEDIVGANYAFNRDNAIHKLRPGKAIFGSEDLNEKTTRGQYADDPTNGMRSCYHAIDAGWTPLLKRPFDCGAFVWTGFDYKGEPNPYGWPDVANNTGLMDSCGFPKDKYYYYESCWSDKPMAHLLPDTWNWPGREGKLIRVIAFSNAKQVELFLNGKSLGAKDFPRDSHIEWKVPYQPGRLEAKAFVDGKTVATEVLDTTGPPARIELSPDRTDLHADGEDAVIVPVSILDADGHVVPDATNRVSFELSGGGRILGVGNGNPADHDSDRANERNAFHGHCIVILQAGHHPSTLRLTATSPGLPSTSTAFNVQ